MPLESVLLASGAFLNIPAEGCLTGFFSHLCFTFCNGEFQTCQKWKTESGEAQQPSPGFPSDRVTPDLVAAAPPPPSGHPPLLPSPECLRHRRHLLKTTATRDQPTTRDQPANVGTPGALESLATKHGPGASPAAYSLFRPGLSPLRALQSTLCLLWPDAPSLLFSFLLISVLRKPGG